MIPWAAVITTAADNIQPPHRSSCSCPSWTGGMEVLPIRAFLECIDKITGAGPAVQHFLLSLLLSMKADAMKKWLYPRKLQEGQVIRKLIVVISTTFNCNRWCHNLEENHLTADSKRLRSHHSSFCLLHVPPATQTLPHSTHCHCSCLPLWCTGWLCLYLFFFFFRKSSVQPLLAVLRALRELLIHHKRSWQCGQLSYFCCTVLTWRWISICEWLVSKSHS